uniref:Uncharacterized protein n=1 Tax=Anguilla anguilla TaxID=7936 RepID=A0A0E9WRG5_ANGAN
MRTACFYSASPSVNVSIGLLVSSFFFSAFLPYASHATRLSAVFDSDWLFLSFIQVLLLKSSFKGKVACVCACVCAFHHLHSCKSKSAFMKVCQGM